MSEPIAKRIKRYRTDRNLTQQQVADSIGVSRVAVSKWESGNTKDMKRANLLGMCKLFGVSLDDLLGASRRFRSNVIDEPGAYIHDLAGQASIPVISYVQAGNWREIVDAFAPGAADEYVPSSASYGPATFALRVVGNSMAPDYVEGDIIIVDPDVSPRPGECVVAKNHREEATFKKYRPRGRNADGVEVYELVPLNEDYETLRSDLDQTIIIGTVMEHIRITRR